MEPQKKEPFTLEIHVTRHGQTESNKSRTLCGQNHGKLTQKGVEQAQKLGAHFKDSHFDKIYVSDLGRTKKTFLNMCKSSPHLSESPVEYLEVLRQRSCGEFTGKPLKYWDEQASKVKCPIRSYRCPGGESWVDVNKRVHAFIKHIVTENIIRNKDQNIERQVQSECNRRKLLVVCHGGYIMEFHNACREIDSKGKEKAVFENSARNCSVHVFKLQYPQATEEYSQENIGIKCIINNYVEHMTQPTTKNAMK